MLLTVAIPTYDDYERLRLTVHSLKLHHKGLGFEILVFDNFGCAKTRAFCEKAGVKYVVDSRVKGTCYAKSRAIQESEGQFVLVIDSHVLVGCDGVKKLQEYLSKLGPDKNDILHGPLVSDKGVIIATEMICQWQGEAWGVWHDRTKSETIPLEEGPTLIWSHGCGLFCVRRSTWPGYHPRCEGFGGEEGVIQSLYRVRGGQALLLPFLTWTHSFNEAATVKHVIRAEDKFRNYLLNIGFLGDRYQIWSDCITHFSQFLCMDVIKRVCRECLPSEVKITSSITVEEAVK